MLAEAAVTVLVMEVFAAYRLPMKPSIDVGGFNVTGGSVGVSVNLVEVGIARSYPYGA